MDENLESIENLIDLSLIDEETVLKVLKSRYEKELIYTFIGNILVAINPYKLFDIYGINVVKKYENQILGKLKPHLFAIGNAAFSKLIKDKENQLFIVSGESGSGKTESIKLILQYLAAINKSKTNILTEQILESNPLLEAFGNAKTIKNNNSSRFGKFLEIYFKDGLIIGANIKHYLLEKPRIVSQLQDERNYHVFYEILAGFTEIEKEKYGLQSADKYFYLNQGNSHEISGKNDAKDFSFLLSSFQVLGFTNEQQDTIFRILASVLHLGNIYFNRKYLKNGQEGVEIGTDVEIRWACHLLQLNIENVFQTLTCRVNETKEGDKLFMPYNIDQALDARDAIAKTLYDGLFYWLLLKLNEKTNSQAFEVNKNLKTISMLDFFGFENSNENSFEQLCINYSTERLNQHFIQFVFKLEQQEYLNEKIDCKVIEFVDNIQIINLLIKKPIGIFPLLDDECNFPKATDQSFLDKCHYNHALNELYARPRMSSFDFGIKHYSGVVWYSADGFLDKNRDTLKNEVIDLLISSKMPMVSKMFVQYKQSMESPNLRNTINSSKYDLNRFTTMKPRTPTISARFQESFNSLYQQINKISDIWYICCIKPNIEKKPLFFDDQLILEQIDNMNLVSVIKARKANFPIRKKFSIFINRYRCIEDTIDKNLNSKQICEFLLRNYSNNLYKFGLTKVFMKESLENLLEESREKIISNAVITIQKYIKGYLQRCSINKLKLNAIKIQSFYRCYIQRKNYLKIRKSIILIQATYKMILQKRKYKKMILSKQKELKQQKIEIQNNNFNGLDNLDIPDNLNEILNNCHKFNFINEKNIQKLTNEQLTNFKKNQLKQLPNDIDQYLFKKFISIYFRSQSWSIKKEPIETSFLPKTNDLQVQHSLILFKLVLRFMNDNTLSDIREKIFSDYIINSALKYDYLKDELLCQLCNQTFKNDNQFSLMRGWLLMINCLSVFYPSSSLFKYLLKYLSDHATDNYKGLFQQKLLNSEHCLPRKYPPTYLEWVSNQKKTNMTLNFIYPNNEKKFCEVNSWSTGETVANDLLTCKGIEDSFGWSIDLEQNNCLFELNGEDFIFDLINEIENPNLKNNKFYIESDSKTEYYFDKENTIKDKLSNFNDDKKPLNSYKNEQIILSKNSKLNKRYLNVEKIDDKKIELDNIKFSETSKLNKRYTTNNLNFSSSSNKKNEDLNKTTALASGVVRKLNKQSLQQQSMSNSNLNDLKSNSLSKRSMSLQELGLATSSALNDRYFDKNSSINKSNSSSKNNSLKKIDNDFSSNNSIISSFSLSTFEIDDKKQNLKPKILSYGNLTELSKTKNENKLFKKSASSYWYDEKSNHLMPPQNNLMNEKQKIPSSAMSDISEAPSLASHVKTVRMPSHASELDQYLDDLFNPVLDGNLDEFSDIRSLAASIKGGDNIKSKKNNKSIIPNQIEKLSFKDFESFFLNENNLPNLIKGGVSDNTDKSSSNDIITNNYTFTTEAALKAQQKGPPIINTNLSNQNTQQQLAFTNVAGMTVPMVDTSQIIQQQLVHQQMIQRAFLASAVQQNLQIQQQLLKQNQALQQLLSTNSSTSPELAKNQNDLSCPSSLVLSSTDTTENLQSIMPIPLLQTVPQIEFLENLASPSKNENNSKQLNKKDDLRNSKDLNEKIKILSNNKNNQLNQQTNVPQPPPLPPAPNSPLAYGSRAKTVRIGKWRWPPPRQEGDGCENSSSHKINQSLNNHSLNDNCDTEIKNTKNEHKETKKIDLPTESISKEFEQPIKNKVNDKPNLSFNKLLSKDEKINELNNDNLKNEQKSFPISKNLSISTNGINQQFDKINKFCSTSNVGKLRISSEMKAKLELLTINQSVRSTTKSTNGFNKGDLVAKSMEDIRENDSNVKKLSEHRKSLLEKQLLGQFETNKKISSVNNLSSPNCSKKLSNNFSKIVKNQNYSRESRERMDELGPHKNQFKSNQIINNQRNGSSASLGALNFCYNCKSDDLTEKEEDTYNSTNCKFYCNGKINQANMSVSLFNMNNLNDDDQEDLIRRKSYNNLFNGIKLNDDDKPINKLYSQNLELGQNNKKINQKENQNNKIDLDQKKLNTKLYSLNKLSYLTYHKVPWDLRLRKELFSPNEKIESPMILEFIFLQIIRDVYSYKCIRMNEEEKTLIKNHLDKIGVNLQNYLNNQHKLTVQKTIFQLARQMPLYFSRFYQVFNCNFNSEINLIAVSHSGLRLVNRLKLNETKEELKILETIFFEDILEINCVKENSIQLLIKEDSCIELTIDKAQQIKSLIEYFIVESSKEDAELVKAISDFNSTESTLLSFKKGDIIAIAKNKNLKIAEGWYYGIHKTTGESGLLSFKYVLPLNNISKFSMNNSEVNEQVPEDLNIKENNVHQSWIETKSENLTDLKEDKMRIFTSNNLAKDSMDLVSENNQASLNDGKFSLLQFALFNFVEAIDKYELIQETTVNSQNGLNKQGTNQVKVVETLRAKKNKKKNGKNSNESNWTWKELSDLVKYTNNLINQPLLRHSHNNLNKISIECFASIMKYMGDLKLNNDQTEVDCVYNILVNCHKNIEIRDEVYCQLMKQTTNNKSIKQDSCQKGWRLFSIVTAYFDCSDNLRPYLFKYLETTAYDKRRAYHATALVCLQNFRKTLRFGGRKNVPSVEEIMAISAGRNSKRQMYRLPGGSERVVNTKSSTVVNDVIEEICLQLNATNSIEQQEFSLYCIVEGDPYTMPLNRDEYILDITTELIKNGQIFYLIFCRSVWYHPLRLDCKLYIEVIFNQVAPDYLEGLLLVLSSNKLKSIENDEIIHNEKFTADPNVNIFADFTLSNQMVNDLCRIAALLHRAADMEHQPTKDEVKYLLPKPILPMKFMKPAKWVELVQNNWADMSAITTMEAKAQCLDILSKWPLFGSCFFAIKHVSVEYNSNDFPEYILALNRNGAYFLDIITHETIWMYAYIDIISTRKVRAEDGTLFLDMKCGNLMQQKVTRIQTDQAHEISRLIRQYIEIQNHEKKSEPLSMKKVPYIQDV